MFSGRFICWLWITKDSDVASSLFDRIWQTTTTTAAVAITKSFRTVEIKMTRWWLQSKPKKIKKKQGKHNIFHVSFLSWHALHVRFFVSHLFPHFVMVINAFPSMSQTKSNVKKQNNEPVTVSVICRQSKSMLLQQNDCCYEFKNFQLVAYIAMYCEDKDRTTRQQCVHHKRRSIVPFWLQSDATQNEECA